MTETSSASSTIDRGRYRKILWFFGRVVLHLIWWDLVVGRVFKKWIRGSRPSRFRRMSRNFRELAIEMGGVQIKLGQFLSSRVDVLPPEVTEELAGLQDEVPPVPFPEISAVLREELGDPADHFAFLDPMPLAAASLGQAHRAKLHSNNGHQPEVVVKVQRPGIADIVRTDLMALRVVARWAMRYGPIRKRADVPALMDEFAETLWEELDYHLEADNAEQFANMFADNPHVRIPAIHHRHSTGRVLVLENIEGHKISDMEQIEAEGIDLAEVAERLMDTYFHQIFKSGFFHADPHPGNLFIQSMPSTNGTAENGSRPFRLAFVDFGMVGRVEDLMGQNLKQVLVSVTKRDARGLTEAYNDLGFFLPGSDLERITEAQARLLDHLWGRNLLELAQPDPQEVQELGKEFRDLLFDFPFQVPRNFVYLGRTIGMLSGLASQLDSTINPWALIERYGQEIIRSQDGRDLTISALLELLQPLITLPAQAQRVLSAAESGRLKVQTTPDRTLLRRLDKMERQVGRLNWNILLAVLFLSGTLLYINGESGLGITAWGIAVLMFIITSLISKQ